MKVLIFGNGQIGNAYLTHFRASGTPVRIAVGVDVTDLGRVDEAVSGFQPDVVINTAAATNLEWCGLNRRAAFDVNVLGAANVAAACDSHGVRLVHYSSGCIFSSTDGRDAKVEDAAPNPASYYGWTKAWSEQMIFFERYPGFDALVLRPRQPVSATISAKNMLVKMLTFAKFVDTPNSGTVIEDLMGWTDELLARDATGVYHVANSGWTTPYRIAGMIRDEILHDLDPELIAKAELDRLTPNRRVDTVLDVTKLESAGIAVAGYEERLQAVVRDLAVNLGEIDRDTLRDVLHRTAEASRQRTVLNDVYPSLYRAPATA